MELILSTIKDLGLWSAGLALLLAYWLFVFGGLHEDASRVTRERWIKRMRHDDWAALYRARVDRTLGWVDKRLTPELASGAGFTATSPRAAWSHGALNLVLLLAVVYPVLSLTLQWAATGAAGQVGEQIVIPSEPAPGPRIATFVGLAAIAIFAMLARRASSQARTAFWLGMMVIVAGAFAAAFAGAFAGAVVFTGAVAFAVTGAGAFAGAVAVAFAFTVAVAVAFTGAVALAVAFAGAVAFAVAFAGLVVQESLGRRTGSHALSLTIYCLTLLVTLALIVRSASEIATTQSGEAPRSLILFFAVLPLLNGLTDFLSLGLTRYLLRRGWPLGWSWLADIAGAVSCLVLFAAAAIAFVVDVTPQNGIPLIYLDQLFDDIERAPEAYWWLAFMVFSTLLPTLLHLIVALSSTIVLTPMRLRLWIADGLEAGAKGDLERGRTAKLVLAGVAALAMWWPSFVILYGGWWLWTTDHGLRDGMLDLARLYAEWIAQFA
ncbi:MAG: hypothetical protein AAF360_17545 [Pseudomonadota bacterium]